MIDSMNVTMYHYEQTETEISNDVVEFGNFTS